MYTAHKLKLGISEQLQRSRGWEAMLQYISIVLASGTEERFMAQAI
jgi:hypothetical protein